MGILCSEVTQNVFHAVFALCRTMECLFPGQKSLGHPRGAAFPMPVSPLFYPFAPSYSVLILLPELPVQGGQQRLAAHPMPVPCFSPSSSPSTAPTKDSDANSKHFIVNYRDNLESSGWVIKGLAGLVFEARIIELSICMHLALLHLFIFLTWKLLTFDFQ